MKNIFGIVGWSGSGKTDLVTRLINFFVLNSLVVSSVKHTHHQFQIDREKERTVYLGCTTTSDMYISNSPLVSTLPLRLDDELSLLILLTLIFYSINSIFLSLTLSEGIEVQFLKFSQIDSVELY